MSALRYRPEIDGLRAIAVIPVVLFHMGVEWIPGGFAGVDVFFVISGYLITSIILKESRENAFTLKGFWMRRVRRIAPALLAMLGAVGIYSAFTVYTPDTNKFGFQGLASLFSFANLYFWRASGNYWGQEAEGSPLLHTWSLSVEEQFYLAYPIFMAFLLKRRPRWALPATLLIAASSFTLFCVLAREHSTATFYLPPTRAWELAVGCALAIALSKRNSGPLFPSVPVVQNLAPNFGLAVILISFLWFIPEGNISWTLAAPVLGAGAIIAFCGPGSSTYDLLASRPVVFIGKISYSLYLWHWPFLVFNRSALKPLPTWALLACITVFSLISYYWVERPTRKARKLLAPTLAFAGLVALLFSVLTRLQANYDSTNQYETSVWKGLSYDLTPDQSAAISELNQRLMEVTFREPGLENAYRENGLIHQYGGETPDVVLMGDSHGLMWAPVVDQICSDLDLTVCFWTMTGISPLLQFPIEPERVDLISPQQKFEFDQARFQSVLDWRPLVIIATRWSARAPEEAISMMENFESMEIESLLIEQPPELFFGDKATAEYLTFLELQPASEESTYIRAGNLKKYNRGVQLVRNLARSYSFCQLASIRDVYSKSEDQVWVAEGKNLLYLDDDHLNLHGASKAYHRILRGILMRE